MSHMLRKSARAMLGKHVIVHHAEGWSCSGVLHSMTHDGIYLMNVQRLDLTAGEDTNPTFQHAVGNHENVEVDHVFFPFFFIPFAALVGIAAASAARPPYYYYGPYPPYGYGPYPGYW